MRDDQLPESVQRLSDKHPRKFVNTEAAFSRIHRGDRIFIGTACGEPQFLVQALVDYAESHPTAIYDAEVFHVWTLGVAPYTDAKFKRNFRHNSFFIGNDTRDAVNSGAADYTPIFLSQVPGLFQRGIVPVDVALVQVSLPDEHGYMSLGVSVDIVKAAVEQAGQVIVQINPRMPRVHGDTFIHIDDVDSALYHEEDLLLYQAEVAGEVAESVGRYVARVVKDGDTIQVGYGALPNGIMRALWDKKHLGVHTELLSDGLMELIRRGVVDNSRKTINRGKTVAAFCMGTAGLYEFLDDNPGIELRPVDYTNNPLVIAQHKNMVAINSALEIDLTGQSTAESIGEKFYSGIGGQADFMRGVVMSPGGRTILAMQSTANHGKESRVVPFLSAGAGTTLIRGDVHYVVTEYGIAYLHGKNIRERAMDLIAIAHPKFRPELIREAKRRHLVYEDQAFIPGKRGEYLEDLETFRTTGSGVQLFIRSVKISDEPLLKDFFYSLSDQSIYRRFISARKDMPHERLQEFCIIDNTRERVVLAIQSLGEKEEIVGVGQYGIAEDVHTADVAFVVRDERQKQGIGLELLSYLTLLAKRQGLLGFTAEVLAENRPMLHLFEKMGFDISRRSDSGVWELKMMFTN
jgi:acyl-CoA hydrolase/GNAT superfamily N-acetyltransferase